MNEIQKNIITNLLHQSGRLSISEFIKLLIDTYPGQVTFSTSFSYEDQAITHEILSNKLPVSIFTLTGTIAATTCGSIVRCSLAQIRASD